MGKYLNLDGVKTTGKFLMSDKISTSKDQHGVF